MSYSNTRLVPISENQLQKWQETCGVPLQRGYVYRLALRTQFRGITWREGMILRGKAGWSEFAPFWDYDTKTCVRWLRAALADATQFRPEAKRQSVPVNVTVPVVSPERAFQLVKNSGGCATAKVKVADPGVDLGADLERVKAVRQALDETVGRGGKIRIDVNAAWDVETAIAQIPRFERAAQGLEYVEQPCLKATELQEVKKRVGPKIAADESIRLSPHPLQDLPDQAADVMVVKVQPLGGVNKVVQLANQAAERGMTVTVSSAIDSGVGIGLGLSAAAALNHLPHACGLATSQLLVEDLIKYPWQVQLGRLCPQEVVVNQELAERGSSDLAGQLLLSKWVARVQQIFAANPQVSWVGFEK